MKKFIKNNIKSITLFILGLLVSGEVVYAAVAASAVTYSNSRSGLKYSNGNNVTNVQDAIDVLYTNANTTITSLQTTNTNLSNQNQTLLASNNSLSNEVDELTNEKSELQTQYNTLLSDYIDNLSGTNIYTNSVYSDTRGTSNSVSVEIPSGKYICSAFILSSASNSVEGSTLSDSPVYTSNPNISNCDATTNLNSNARQMAKEKQTQSPYYIGFDVSYNNFICEVNSTKTITVSFSATDNSFISTGRVIICNKIK